MVHKLVEHILQGNLDKNMITEVDLNGYRENEKYEMVEDIKVLNKL